MTKEQYIERYGLDKYEQHKEYMKEYNKEYQKERRRNDPEYREYHKEYWKEYNHNNMNNVGKLKNSIRTQSSRILFKQRKHTRLKDYEIHHCFGYEDPTKFIYIPKSLHIKIHQYLRDNNIDADSNHYKYISTMINECEEYTYISV